MTARKPKTVVAPVPAVAVDVKTNLQTRQARLNAAYDVADAANDGPRADAVWRAVSRVDAQLNTLKLSNLV